MAELPTSSGSSSPGSEAETLGQYLRRIRIGNGIDLKKMSADTRLGLETLTAVEKDDYKKIPGATYQKVFIKNISKYLGLDPEKIYQRFLQEAGLAFQGTGNRLGGSESPAGEIPAEENKASMPEPRPPARGLLILVSVLAGTLVLVLLARRNLPEPEIRRAPADTLLETESEPATGEESLSQTLEPPAAAPAMDAPEPGTPLNEAQSDSVAPKKNPFSQERRGALQLTVTCLKESCYVSAFRNNRPWNNLLREGEYKTFASDSTLYFWIDPLSAASLSLNGAPIAPPEGSAGRFSLGQNGVEALTFSAWKLMTERR